MIRNILAGNYSHILGLGDYRRNAKAMRIETCFINQFGKQQIRDGGAEVLHSNWQLPQLPGTMISQTTSNGPCNYSAYTLLTLIAEYGLSSHLGFIHVPRKFEEQAGLELVSDLTLATS
jgi:pyrrolidone-carboxylate peptidase